MRVTQWVQAVQCQRQIYGENILKATINNRRCYLLSSWLGLQIIAPNDHKFSILIYWWSRQHLFEQGQMFKWFCEKLYLYHCSWLVYFTKISSKKFLSKHRIISDVCKQQQFCMELRCNSNLSNNGKLIFIEDNLIIRLVTRKPFLQRWWTNFFKNEWNH